MGIKIKKDEKQQSQRLKTLKVKYIFAVPLVGIMNIITMLAFFFDPSTNGMTGVKAFFLFFALIGVGFTFWSYSWNVVSDNRRIVVNPVIGKAKEVTYDRIKKVETHKKKKHDSMVYYSLIDVNDKVIVKIYPLMRNSGDLFNRLKQMNIVVEELKDA